MRGKSRPGGRIATAAASLRYRQRAAEAATHALGSRISCQGQGQECENKELADI